MKKKKWLYLILFFLNVGLVLFFGWKVLLVLSEYREGESSYDALADEYVQEENEEEYTFNSVKVDDNLDEEKVVEAAPIVVSFPELLNQCDDVVAWVYCEGTNVNYPVVQSEDNDYYLRRLLDGTWNTAGTIFMDYRNASDFSDWNNILYGHNMKNDSMFGILENYKDHEYYVDHSIWYLLTPEKEFRIDLIGGYTTFGGSDDTYSIPDTFEGRNELVATAQLHSTFQSRTVINEQDKLITLSTCSYDYDNARYVLVGVLHELGSNEKGEN